MKILILGASGATGKLVTMQFVKRKINVRILVRENAFLPKEILESANVEILKGNICDFNNEQILSLLKDCTAVISCLGHNITFKGIFGKPHYLVYSTIKKICEAIEKNESSLKKIILMSTTAYTNKDNGEKNKVGEKIIFALLMLLLPPHKDNMRAGKYLNRKIGKKISNIEWVAVRPDTLFNEEVESKYNIYESLIRSPMFNAGKTSRINVSHFMAELINNEELWEKWKYKMPVIYNEE